jgi:hypothetical protein
MILSVEIGSYRVRMTAPISGARGVHGVAPGVVEIMNAERTAQASTVQAPRSQASRAMRYGPRRSEVGLGDRVELRAGHDLPGNGVRKARGVPPTREQADDPASLHLRAESTQAA